MEKLLCIKDAGIRNLVKKGKWYFGEKVTSDGKYSIFGKGELNSSELILHNSSSSVLVGYDDYKGIFDKELFITKSKWRDNRLKQLLNG